MSPSIQPHDDRTALRLIADLASPALFNKLRVPYQALEEVRQLALFRLCEPDSTVAAKIELLEYLLDVAQSSSQHEIWRALFVEMLYKYKTELQRDDHT